MAAAAKTKARTKGGARRARRAGRPRAQGVARTPSGQISRAKPAETPAAIVAAAALYRKRHCGRADAADPRLETPLGVLAAHGKIRADELTAGQRYASAYRAQLRAIAAPPRHIATLGDGPPIMALSAAEERRKALAARQAWDDVLACLDGLQRMMLGTKTSVIRDELDRVCLDQDWPRNAPLLRFALLGLARHFDGEKI